jgi:hypothetical protein
VVERPFRRILRGKLAVYLFPTLIALGIVAVFDWIDYHVKGKSTFIGINPRCTDQFGGHCFKLDTTDLPWDATAARWLDQWIWLFMIALAALGIGALVMLLVSAANRRPSRKQRGRR